MSAVPRHPHDIGYAGLRMTADEYLALGETKERYELIHGIVVMSPSPLGGHNETAAEIIFQLKRFSGANPAIRVFPETDIRFHADTVYRPDISMYLSDRLPQGRVDRFDIPPDLIIEILSAGTKALDFITKRDDYDRFGVGEYWIVDPSIGRVRCWQRQGAHLLEVRAEGDSIPSATIAGFSFDLRPIRTLMGT